jgi:hypothetical protein
MLRTLIACLAMMLTIAVASARDVIILKDGRRVEGDIVREIDGNLWVLVYIGDVKKQEFFAATAVEEVRRDAVTDVAEKPADSDDEAAGSGAPKGMVITLEGMVGVEMAAHKLEELIPMIEKEIGEGGILVLKINSGGGFLAEIPLLSDTIEYKLKPKFEVVGWIESAISAAAMTGITMERLYFMPEGNLGAATGWYGALTAVRGRGLAETDYLMEQISARGKREYSIMAAMQGSPDEGRPLSCTVDPETGRVTWYTSEDDGEILVNRSGDVLTFNSVMAEQVRFSEGIARDVFELAREMGYDEIDWVGEWKEGMVHPISKAERENRRWREFIDQNNQGMVVAWNKYAMYSNAAEGQQGDNRGVLVGKARTYLRQMKRYAEASPKLVTVSIGIPWDAFDDWYAGQVEYLRELMRP